MMSLPPARTPEEFAALRRDETALSPGVREIARRHGLAGRAARRFPSGSLPVYALGDDLVLKLYPPCFAEDETVERSALTAVAGALPVPTPRIREAGELDGWRYLVMDRLRGVPLSEVWDAIPPPSRARLAEDLGRAAAALHRIDHRGLSVLRPDWPEFLARQTATCVERQRAAGLAEPWLARIDDFLAGAAVPPDAPLVLLHTELMREHVFVEEGAGGFRLSGLLDFEPAMVGAAEYEFASVGLFVARGDRDVLRRFFRGYYGGPPPPGLAERALAYTLLHRYSNLRRYLELLPPPPGTDTLAALAEAWWAT